jgi:hypothetical protein
MGAQQRAPEIKGKGLKMEASKVSDCPKGQRCAMHERELAERWGIAVTTLQKWRQIGYGPAFLKLSARVLYPIEAVEAFEREKLRKSTSEKA